MQGAWQAGWYGSGVTPMLIWPFALFAGGVTQSVAAIASLRARDGVAVAVHSVGGSFWVGWGHPGTAGDDARAAADRARHGQPFAGVLVHRADPGHLLRCPWGAGLEPGYLLRAIHPGGRVRGDRGRVLRRQPGHRPGRRLAVRRLRTPRSPGHLALAGGRGGGRGHQRPPGRPRRRRLGTPRPALGSFPARLRGRLARDRLGRSRPAGQPTSAVLALGAEVDAAHAASMVVLGLLSGRWRVPALLDALLAASLASAGLACARERPPPRSRRLRDRPAAGPAGPLGRTAGPLPVAAAGGQTGSRSGSSEPPVHEVTAERTTP
jgi:hypothetical protein